MIVNMIAEQVTITSDRQSLRQILQTARGENIPYECAGIVLKLADITDTTKVSLSDQATVNPIIVLDAGQDLIASNFNNFNCEKVYLQTDGSDVTVDVIIEVINFKRYI